MQAAFIMQSLSTIKKFGTDYSSLKPHTMEGWCGHVNEYMPLSLSLSNSSGLFLAAVLDPPLTPNQHLASRPGQICLLQKRLSGATRELSFFPDVVGGWVQLLSLRVRARLRKTWSPGRTPG